MKLTVGYSTRKIDNNYIDSIKRTIGLKENEYEIIPLENNGLYSLSEAYNIILDKSKSDIVVLMHDDIKIESNWGKKLIVHFNKGTHDIIGVAGTTNFPKSGMWWENKESMIGIVKHSKDGKTWVNKYSESQGYDIKTVVIVDGLFIAFDKTKIKHKFDEEFKGFHFYDIAFCFPNYLDGINIGVVTDIKITHLSIGQTNQEWEENRKQFVEKYKSKFKQKIKIFSGWSNKGGSTIALINLTNELNKNGYDATYYGPHNWHLDKCDSKLLNQDSFNNLLPSDILITHFLELKSRPNVKKVILTCHEKWWFKVGEINKYWDTCIFLHQEHRKYHNNYSGNYEIIPNIKENLIIKPKKNIKIAGIIGGIEERKQTHLSINRAINDNCVKIYLFGDIIDKKYYETNVKEYIDNKKVIHYGYINNKQDMYDMIDRVYHTSNSEVASLVKDECMLTNTLFFGNIETENKITNLNNNEIIKLWKKIL
jgi:hypothetical protein